MGVEQAALRLLFPCHEAHPAPLAFPIALYGTLILSDMVMHNTNCIKQTLTRWQSHTCQSMAKRADSADLRTKL